MGLRSVDAKKYDSVVKGGQSFLVRFQADEDRQYKADHKFYGGIGYRVTSGLTPIQSTLRNRSFASYKL